MAHRLYAKRGWGGKESNLASHLTLLESAGLPSNIEPVMRTLSSANPHKGESARTPAILDIFETPFGTLSQYAILIGSFVQVSQVHGSNPNIRETFSKERVPNHFSDPPSPKYNSMGEPRLPNPMPHRFQFIRENLLSAFTAFTLSRN